MRYVVGIDAGGTQSTGLLADETGRILREARRGGANLQTHGELAVEKVVHELLVALSADGPPSAVCLGMAGVDRPRDGEIVRGILRRLGHWESALVVNDAVIALAAGAPDRHGIVVVAGTGSIAYGSDPTGRSARAGGLGYVLADQGSAYWLGHEALRAAVKSADGRGPRTSLHDIVLEALGAAEVADLVPRVHEKGMERNEIAALAPCVERAAQEGDAVALALLALAVEELRAAACAVRRRLDFGAAGLTFVLSGGVFKASPRMAVDLSRTPGFQVARTVVLDRTPAHGAVALALEAVR